MLLLCLLSCGLNAGFLITRSRWTENTGLSKAHSSQTLSPCNEVRDAKFGQWLPCLNKSHLGFNQTHLSHVLMGLQDSCCYLNSKITFTNRHYSFMVQSKGKTPQDWITCPTTKIMYPRVGMIDDLRPHLWI